MTADPTDTDQPTPRYRIVAGGTPTPEELAALTIALTPVAVQQQGDADAAAMSAWLRAALHEGVADLRVTSAGQAADLR